MSSGVLALIFFLIIVLVAALILWAQTQSPEAAEAVRQAAAALAAAL